MQYLFLLALVFLTACATKKIIIRDDPSMTFTKNLSPKITYFTKGSGLFQTTNNPKFIEVTLVGAGGSGSGGNNLGMAGDNTRFGTLEAKGGRSGKKFRSGGYSGKYLSFKITNPHSSYPYMVGQSYGPLKGGDGLVKITEYY